MDRFEHFGEESISDSSMGLRGSTCSRRLTHEMPPIVAPKQGAAVRPRNASVRKPRKAARRDLAEENERLHSELETMRRGRSIVPEIESGPNIGFVFICRDDCLAALTDYH